MIRIESINKPITEVEWSISSHCNFTCNYCKEYNNTQNPFPKSFDNMITFLKKIPNKKRINLLGGEVTLWEKLPDFINECNKNNIEVNLTTNGSASMSWWNANFKKFSCVSISYHHLQGNINHINKIINLFNVNKKSITVLVMVDKTYFNDIINIGRNIDIKVGQVKYSPIRKGGELQKYTNEEINIMNVLNKKIKNNLKYIINGVTELTNAKKLIINNKNNFKGWYCNAGIEHLRVHMNGDIWRCWGGEANTCGGVLGNIDDKSFELPTEPIICNKYHNCSCVPEVCITKWKF